MTVVLRIDNQYLVLSHIKRNHADQIIQAYVVNGDWTLKIKNKQAYAVESRAGSTEVVRHLWTPILIKEIQVENTKDYNLAITRARLAENDTSNEWAKYKVTK